MSDEHLLELHDIEKRFGATRALAGVSLTLARGRVHALLGENGAGKSTLVAIVAGALAPDGGAMRLSGAPFAPRSPAEARAAGVAYVPQEPELCDHLDVAENVLLGCEPARLGVIARPRAHALARAALAELGAADRLPLGTPAARLGPGDRQLVAIARALGRTEGCTLLVLDEPTASLTAADTERMFAAVGRLRERGLGILYISHFLDEVHRIADGYTVLRDGRSVASGRMAEVTPEALVAHMIGDRPLATPASRAGRPPGDVVLEIDRLAGDGKPIEASLTLRAGEIVGIAGLLGAGRTALLRTLFGLRPVRAGRVRVGAWIGPASPARRLAQGVGLLSEDRKGEGLALGMSVADNLTLSRLEGLGPAGLVLPGAQRAAARRLVDRLRIRCRDEAQPVAELSGGNQQRVALGRLLHHDVDVLLLDEPTRGVDVASRSEVHALIAELARAGKAVLVVSSQLAELCALADRIAIMRRGRLGPARPRAELDEARILGEASGR
jgi:ribose transport system ATP-binding protein